LERRKPRIHISYIGETMTTGIVYRIEIPYSEEKKNSIVECLKAWNYKFKQIGHKIEVYNYFVSTVKKPMVIDLDTIHFDAFHDSFKTWR